MPQCLERGALCQGECCCMWVPCTTARRCQLHAHRLSTSADAHPGADLAGRRQWNGECPVVSVYPAPAPAEGDPTATQILQGAGGGHGAHHCAAGAGEALCSQSLGRHVCQLSLGLASWAGRGWHAPGRQRRLGHAYSRAHCLCPAGQGGREGCCARCWAHVWLCRLPR